MYPAREALPYLDKTVPEAWKAATVYGTAVSDEALRQGLARTENELIRLRVSQLNGCLFCLDLHSRQSRQADITQQKLDLLPAWRDSPLFSEREAAVLAIAGRETAVLVLLDLAYRRRAGYGSEPGQGPSPSTTGAPMPDEVAPNGVGPSGR